MLLVNTLGSDGWRGACVQESYEALLAGERDGIQLDFHTAGTADEYLRYAESDNVLILHGVLSLPYTSPSVPYTL
jgi:hypothetical protein